jgi:hypothetical protein
MHTQNTHTAHTVVGVKVMKISRYFQSDDFFPEKYQTSYICTIMSDDFIVALNCYWWIPPPPLLLVHSWPPQKQYILKNKDR